MSERRPRPNVVIILADDMGYSDISCFGGEIPTPHIDQLAASGLRMTQFYNAARCSPARASLLTGLHPHQTGIGILTEDQRPVGYAGTLNDRCVTMAEVLRAVGYGTYMSGKWHLSNSLQAADETWPLGRGFDRFWGTGAGGGSYFWPRTVISDTTPVAPEDLGPGFYYTDAVADHAAQFISDHARDRPDDPYFCYVAFTAPHWPLHAPEHRIQEQRGRFDGGWDQLRQERFKRQHELGLFATEFDPSHRDPDIPAWDDVEEKGWETRRMEVYAAQVAAMDAGVGRVLDTVHSTGGDDETIVIFLSDNGGCAEEIESGWDRWLNSGYRPPWSTTTPDGRPVLRGNDPEIWPGADDTFVSYGRSWANVSNTPFREYKRWVHEGGISTPLIVRWPGGDIEPGAIVHQPHQLTDILPTILEITSEPYPETFDGVAKLPLEGTSMLETWHQEPGADGAHTLYWEHLGNAACRRGRWKLVREFPGPWELYDIATDRGELVDCADSHPEIVSELETEYRAWADRCGVIPREQIIAG